MGSHFNMTEVIVARWIVPVVPKDVVLENHSIVVEDGKILKIAATEKVLAEYEGKEGVTINKLSQNHAIVPGFVNSHCHSSMSLLRSFVDNVPLMEWLEK